ncbi:hypothetical protein IW261DRAFT_1426875 [Armillaria novae-zelandiae]|uniref:Uncharacterized protein n=1 Tax=Armillaria novae-zelandiae TaxID=153914 RepID=A0AA39NIZ7_9AGAR|nr:hypothetical protein IW261DRAFT_1426875 [Armillaria novae-zelandiae]
MTVSVMGDGVTMHGRLMAVTKQDWGTAAGSICAEMRQDKKEDETQHDQGSQHMEGEGGTHGNANGGFNAEGSSKREEGAMDMEGKGEGKAMTNLQTSLFYTVTTVTKAEARE